MDIVTAAAFFGFVEYKEFNCYIRDFGTLVLLKINAFRTLLCFGTYKSWPCCPKQAKGPPFAAVGAGRRGSPAGIFPEGSRDDSLENLNRLGGRPICSGLGEGSVMRKDSDFRVPIHPATLLQDASAL